MKKFNKLVIKLTPAYVLMIITSITFVLASTYNEVFNDAFTITDSLSIALNTNNLLSFSDSFSIFDSLNNFGGSVATTIITIFNTITQIAPPATGNPYVYTGDSFSALVTTTFAPAIVIVGTIFIMFYIGIKYVVPIMVVETVVFLGLAYIQIIPSYFILLVIIMVAALLYRIISVAMNGGSSPE